MLLGRGANANSEDNFGRTPLHLVAEGKFKLTQDHIRIVQLLLEHGAEVNAQDGGNATPLHLASSGGRVAIVHVLLDRGAAANGKDAQGQTPLHLASQCPFRGPDDSKGDGVGITQLLLDHGADVNEQDNNLATPSDLASYHGRTEITSLLFQYGGKANAKIDQRPTPGQPELPSVNFHDEHCSPKQV